MISTVASAKGKRCTGARICAIFFTSSRNAYARPACSIPTERSITTTVVVPFRFPSPNAVPIIPGPLARFFWSVILVMYICATLRLPPGNPSMMRLIKSIHNTRAKPRSRNPMKVPKILTIKTRRRLARSDQRHRIRAPISCASAYDATSKPVTNASDPKV